jgi:N-acetylmuramoyl-L-alanine amidase
LPCLRWISGHDALDLARVEASDDPSRLVRRKLDPGPLFPWTELLAAVPLEPLDAGSLGVDASA